MLYYDKEHKNSCDGKLTVQTFESVARPDLKRCGLCCTKCDAMFYAKDAMNGWRKSTSDGE